MGEEHLSPKTEAGKSDRPSTIVTLLIAFLVISCSLFVIALLWTSFSKSQGYGVRLECTKKLRSIAIASIQYANDYRYFPHMTALDKPHSEEHVSDVFRTLIYLQYLDDAEVFICPASEDSVIAPGPKVLDDAKLWDWNNAAKKGRNKTPAQSPGSINLFRNNELSYSTLRNSLRLSETRSDTLLFSDKAIKEDFDPVDPPEFEMYPLGNHDNAMNIAFGDCHVEYHELSKEHMPSHIVDNSQPMYQLRHRLHLGLFDPT
jgi:prepilin-type processing-associated H-X9-DG protein